MRRNIELLGSILSFMQDHEDPTQCCKEIENGAGKALGHSWPGVRLHLALLKDMGLVAECTTPAEYRLTSVGYDVIESPDPVARLRRSEEPTSELQSLMRISYAVFCLQK